MPATAAADGKKKKKKGEEEIKIPKELIGQFLPEQYRLTLAMFTATDKKKSGFVDVKEMGYMLRMIGGNPTDAEIEEWTDAVRDENGKMNILGFVQAAAFELRTRKTDVDIVVAFKEFDKHETGLVSGAQIRHHLTETAEKFEPRIVDELLTEAIGSTDDSGNVNYRTFVHDMDAYADKAFLKKAKKLGLAEKKTKKGKKKAK